MQRKLARYLEPVLHMSLSDHYHWWFALISDPIYANELTYVKALHEIESVETRYIVLEIMLKLYNYIVDAELDGTPDTAPPAMNTTNWSLFFK